MRKFFKSYVGLLLHSFVFGMAFSVFTVAVSSLGYERLGYLGVCLGISPLLFWSVRTLKRIVRNITAVRNYLVHQVPIPTELRPSVNAEHAFLSRVPSLWELFSFILPGKVRREAFDPAFNDMLKDYVRARKFRGKWTLRWLAFAFTVRSLLMVLDCFRVMLQSGAGKILLNFLPDVLRKWWRAQ